jgi:regulatory protein
MDLLARREHGREELASKLTRRFRKREPPTGLIDDTLDTLEAEGLLSDCRYAESLLRQLLAKGVGPLRLRQEILQRGLTSEARAHIQPDIEGADWCALAEDVYQKKFGGRESTLADFDALRKEQARRIRFMQYRGFCSEHFQHLIEALQMAGEEAVDDDI